MTATKTQADFTIRSANATLPLVNMITSDIVNLSREILETRERLAYTVSDRRDEADEYSKELKSIDEVTDEKSSRLEALVEELALLNVDTRNAIDGFVDFPAIRGGEQVSLCWRLGETEVMHWHAANESCQQRRLVDLPLVQMSVRRQFSASAKFDA
jgi:hypothetical protein